MASKISVGGGTLQPYPTGRVNSSSGFVCNCLVTWTGSLCELDVNECETNLEPCVYGTCENQIGNEEFICHCDPGWTGGLCDIDIDECESNPCQNYGTCVESIAKYTCFCPKLVTGVHRDGR